MGDVFTEDIFDEVAAAPTDRDAASALGQTHLREDRNPAGAGHITAYTHLRKIPSFQEPKRTCLASSIIVIVDRPGPLLMQLKMHPSRKCVCLHGFDRDEDGDRGELELSGKLRAGDLLIDINGKSLELKSFKEVLGVIRQEGVSGGPRVLSLIRFPSPQEEAEYFGHSGVTLKDSAYFDRSEGILICNL